MISTEKVIEFFPFLGNFDPIYVDFVLGTLHFLMVFVCVYLLVKFFYVRLLNWLGRFAHRTRSHWDDAIIGTLRKIRPWFFVAIALINGVDTLGLPHKMAKIIHVVLYGLILIQVMILLMDLIREVLERFFVKHEDKVDPTKENITRNLLGIIKFVLGIAAFLFFLDNFGVNVTSLITGLGIGGIAIALAAQKILGDTFSSFTIVFDRPFEVGDYISIENYSGTVEHVGLKTTRIRSLDGEVIVLGNSYLTDNGLRNFQKLTQRRVVLKFGLSYGATGEKITEFLGRIKQLFQGERDLVLDRAHFTGFGESSLLFEAVYYIKRAEYALMMDYQQKTNLAVMKLCQELELSLAVPAREVLLRAQDHGTVPSAFGG